MFLCTFHSISKGSFGMCCGKDINVCYSWFSQNSFLFECVIWTEFFGYVYQCLFNKWWGSSCFKQAFVLWYIFLFINCLMSNVLREGYGCILWRLWLVSFCMWQKVKFCDDKKMANGYRFRAQAVSSHVPEHGWFGILVAFLSNWHIGKFWRHLRRLSSLI